MAPVSTLGHIFRVAQREHQLVEELGWVGQIQLLNEWREIVGPYEAHLGMMLRLKTLLQHPFRPCISRKTWCHNVERRVVSRCRSQERQDLRHFEEAPGLVRVVDDLER